MTKPHNDINRRNFMRGTVIAAASATSLHIIPNSVLGGPGRKAPSDDLRFGVIGVGGRGSAFLRPHVTTALCDVDQNRLHAAAERVGGNPKLFTDYRDLLDVKDIDAVFIATPDHWHALQTIHACEAGKDVYVEKPASNTIEEGRAMVEAARRYSRVVQVGAQGRSQEVASQVKSFIVNGQIGEVQRVVCWHYENPRANWSANPHPPAELDYDSWVGPSPWIPYNPQRTHGAFRWMMFSGGGQIRDRGAHVMSLALWIMNCDDTGPYHIEATGKPYPENMYDTPHEMEVIYKFKDPDWELVWGMPGEAHEEGFDWPRRPYGANYIGTKDNLIVAFADTPETNTEQKAKDYTPPEDGVHVFRSPGHRENFENCIRTREKPVMHIEAGHRVATLCILGNLSYELGRALEWDPVNEVFKNDDEANRLLRRPGRGEWQL